MNRAHLQGAFSDSLTRFLHDISAAKSHDAPSPSRVVEMFAQTLGELLIAEGYAINVVFRDADLILGAESKSPTEAAQALERGASLHEIEKRASWHASRSDYGEMSIYSLVSPDSVDAGASSLRIALEHESYAVCDLWISVIAPRRLGERWIWLCGFIAGLRYSFSLLRALVRARWAAELESKNARMLLEAREINADKLAELSDKIDKVTAFVEKYKASSLVDYDRMVVDLTKHLVQEMLGTGWTFREIGKNDVFGVGGMRERFLLTLVAIEDATSQRRLERFGNGELAVALACIGAVIDPTGLCLDTSDVGSDPVLNLLPVWTRAHQSLRVVARSFASDADVHAAQVSWGQAVRQTLPVLAAYLSKTKKGGEAGENERGHASARNWLILWFCQELLVEKDIEKTLYVHEQRVYRAELAYVLREALRFTCWGARADYFYDATSFCAALKELMLRHAERVVGIPRQIQLGTILNALGEGRGMSRFSSIEHLRHVIEIYIAGHYLLSLQVVTSIATEPSRSIAEILATTGIHETEIRRAFTLAATLHDFGHLLFPQDIPDDPAGREEGLPVPQHLRDMIEQTVSKLSDVGQQLTSAALIALGLRRSDSSALSAASPGSYFDDYSQKRKIRLSEWLMQQAKRRMPSHGLLSAWYLHEMCRSKQAEYGFIDTSLGARQAVRAVLLHDAVIEEIDCEKDPVAAVLVLCNEVFEWEPGRTSAAPLSAMTRWVRALNVASTRPPTRDRRLSILDVEVKVDERTHRVHGTLRIVEKRPWPSIEVVLQPPHLLDITVFSLWLAKAQNIGRIRPSKAQHYFSPEVHLKSMIDPAYRLRSTTQTLLQEAASGRGIAGQWQGALQEWLHRNELFEPQDRTDCKEESVRLRFLEQALCPGDSVQSFMRDLERATKDILDS